MISLFLLSGAHGGEIKRIFLLRFVFNFWCQLILFSAGTVSTLSSQNECRRTVLSIPLHVQLKMCIYKSYNILTIAPHFWKIEKMYFLCVIEEIMPIGSVEWETIANWHNKKKYYACIAIFLNITNQTNNMFYVKFFW